MGAKHYSTLNHSKEKIQERVEKGDVNENGDKRVRFHSDICEDKNMNSDSGGVDVNNFFARSRRRIEGIDGLRFTSPVTKNLSSPPRIDSTKKAYAEVLKIGLTRFENPRGKVRET